MNNSIIKNSRIVVTGGAGFIGSNLVSALLKNNNQVICIDNLSTGQYSNIQPFLDDYNFIFIEDDICNLEVCRDICVGADYVFHQAADVSVPKSIYSPIYNAEINIIGFINMLMASTEACVKRFIYASSASVYGDNDKIPISEKSPAKPISPYATTKIVDELYARNFSDHHHIETVGLRYFNVYGKNQSPHGIYLSVIQKFIYRLGKLCNPVIYGNGTNTRDFVHVDDVVQANLLAASVSKPEAINTVYNIGTGVGTTLNALFTIIQNSLIKYEPRVTEYKAINTSPAPGDIKYSVANIDKARKLLGYEPGVSIKDGIEKSIRWYFEQMDELDE